METGRAREIIGKAPMAMGKDRNPNGQKDERAIPMQVVSEEPYMSAISKIVSLKNSWRYYSFDVDRLSTAEFAEIPIQRFDLLL